MPSSVMNKATSSVWTSIARIVGSGIIGGVTMALAGFVEALIAFPAFTTVHHALYPPATYGTVYMTALHSGLPVVLAFLGGVFGGLTIAILTGLRQGSESAWRSLGRLLKAALAGTAFGVVAGVLGGLAVGWSRSPTMVGLFMGYFYGTSLCFLLGLVGSLIRSARKNRIKRREMGDLRDPRVGKAPSVAWRIAMVCLAVGYVATCAGALVLKERSDAPQVRAREASIATATLTRKGQEAPAFVVTTTGGTTFDSGSKRDGPVLINFFATWCGPCLGELARLEPEIWQRYKDRGLKVIVIGVGEQEEAVGEFRTSHGLSMPIAADPESEVFHKFAKGTIPRNNLILTDGRIAYQSVGYSETTFSELEAALKRELTQPQ